MDAINPWLKSWRKTSKGRTPTSRQGGRWSSSPGGGEICDAYNHGWSYREIWRGLEREGIVDFGYWCFTHYIRKIRRRLVEAEKGTASSEGEGKTAANRTAAVKPIVVSPPPAPGSTRVDIPGFGQNLPPRDPKKF